MKPSSQSQMPAAAPTWAEGGPVCGGDGRVVPAHAVRKHHAPLCPCVRILGSQLRLCAQKAPNKISADLACMRDSF